MSNPSVPAGPTTRDSSAPPSLLPFTRVEPETRGDPESPLRWTTKSTRHLARELTRAGHVVSHSVVAKILNSAGYSLQSTRKTLESA